GFGAAAVEFAPRRLQRDGIFTTRRAAGIDVHAGRGGRRHRRCQCPEAKGGDTREHGELSQAHGCKYVKRLTAPTKQPKGTTISRIGTRREPLAGAVSAASRWAVPTLVGVIGLACGLSLLLHGFYAFTTWGVIALVILAVAWGLFLAG